VVVVDELAGGNTMAVLLLLLQSLLLNMSGVTGVRLGSV
jgi:hypothetical protein